jgi:hypothetical protein
MKSLSVGELKAQFSEVLAKIVPFEEPKKKKAKDRIP